METPTAPLTIAHIDETFDQAELDALIEANRPYGCESIEFIDDNTKRGYRAFEYKVSVVARHEHDEDGWSPVYESYPVSIQLTAETPLTTVAFLLIGEINALIES